MFNIKILHYEFASADDLGLHAELPTITFRGAFGYALAQVIAREVCIPRMHSRVELYKRVFMPTNEAGSKHSRNQDLARPFVLRGFYSRPDKKSFILEVILFGIATEHEAFFDRVVEVMSYMGIGKNKRICHFEKLDSYEVELSDPEPTGGLLVNFLSPCCRMKSGGRIYEDFIPFNVLLPRLLDRVVELDNLYGSGSFEKDWDLHALKQQADFVAAELIEGGIYNVHRTSGRSGQEMSLKGFVGKILYSGDLSFFREVLRYLPWINIGRFNVFGCGWCQTQYIK